MNKRQIIASLNKIANELDNYKLYTEANNVTKVMKRLASDFTDKDRGDYIATSYIINSFDETIQKMKHDPMISQAEKDKVIEIMKNLEQYLEENSDNMSLDDDLELGLGAVPHKKIKSPMNSSDYDKDGDINLSKDVDEF